MQEQYDALKGYAKRWAAATGTGSVLLGCVGP
jgi:hypothetical protein